MGSQRLTYLFFIWVCPWAIFAQSFSLHIIPQDSSAGLFLDQHPYQQTHIDSSSSQLEWMKTEKTIVKNGFYLYAHEQFWRNDTLRIKLRLNDQMNHVILKNGNINNFVLSELHLDFSESDTFLLEESEIIVESLLYYYEDNGYPFAQLKFDDIAYAHPYFKATLNLYPGPYRRFDSVVVKGNTTVPKGYLRYHLGYKNGRPYNESSLYEITEEIDKSPFIKNGKSPQLLFEPQKTTTFLYIEKQNANSINGIAGLNTREDGSVFLTGEFDLQLYHVFKAAEEIKLHWSTPRENSQQLKLGLELPFLFNSPLGLTADFKLYREDTIFSNSNFEGGLTLKPNAKSGIAILYRSKSSTSLTVTEGISSFNSKYVVFQAFWKKLNHGFLPTKGIYADLKVGQGDRISEGTKDKQYLIETEFNGFFSPHKRHGFFIGADAAGLFNTPLVLNEVYRIGGLNSIRGFNEQSIFASSYAFAQLEYRLFLDRYTYVFLFNDMGYFDNIAANPSFSSTLWGLGTGLSFYSKGGIFSLAFAVGNQDQNGFDLRNTKVHLGYSNRF